MSEGREEPVGLLVQGFALAIAVGTIVITALLPLRLSAAALVALCIGLLASIGFVFAVRMSRQIDWLGVAVVVAAIAFGLWTGSLEFGWRTNSDVYGDFTEYRVAAARIIEHGSATIPDPLGVGLPGFRPVGNGQLAPIHPQGYPGALAVISGDGLLTLAQANAMIFGLVLALIYVVGRTLGGPLAGLTACVLFGSNAAVGWFFKYPHAENLTALLVLLAAQGHLRRQDAGSRWQLAAGFVALFAAVLVHFFTILLLVVLVLLSVGPHLVTWIRAARLPRWSLPTALALVVGAGSAILVAFGTRFFGRAASDLPKFLRAIFTGEPANPDYAFSDLYGLQWPYVMDSYTVYGMSPFLLLVLGGIVVGEISRRCYQFLGLTSPYLLFFLYPGISPSQPWFMRRFYASIFLATTVVATAVGVRLAHRNRFAGVGLVVGALVIGGAGAAYAWPVWTLTDRDDPTLDELLRLVGPSDAVVLTSFRTAAYGPSLRVVHDRVVVDLWAAGAFDHSDPRYTPPPDWEGLTGKRTLVLGAVAPSPAPGQAERLSPFMVGGEVEYFAAINDTIVELETDAAFASTLYEPAKYQSVGYRGVQAWLAHRLPYDLREATFTIYVYELVKLPAREEAR